MTSSTWQLRVLFFTRFANAFALVTLLTLLPTYINILEPEGIVLGMFATGLTLAQAGSVIPVSWAGDRFDKRTVLLAGLGLSVVVYVSFPLVGSSLEFIVARGAQGVAATGAGLIALALVSQLARDTERANTIGMSNAWRMAAGGVGALSAGGLYDLFGFGAVFGLLTLFAAAAFVLVYLFVEPDETTVEGFAFADLALNRRILTLTSFRAQYAVAVTLVRTWVPIFAGLAAADGGLALSALAVGIVVATEKFVNMALQPLSGRLSDRRGRARFVFLGGLAYGVVALLVPFTPAIGAVLGLPETYPLLGPLSAAFLPLVALNGLLGLADSVREPASMALFADVGTGNGVAAAFGVRDLVWRPGSVLAPLLGGWLTTEVGIAWVFYLGAAAAFTGVAAFLAILLHDHGRRGLSEW